MAEREVVVIDIQMPFWSMVAFIIKWTIASIPAMLFIFAIGFAISMIVGVLGIGAAGALGGR